MINRPPLMVMGFVCLVGITFVGLRGASAEQEPHPVRRVGPDSVRNRLEALERRLAEVERRLEIPTTAAERGPSPIRLEGRWLMTLPAGFEHRVTLEPVGSDRYRLKSIRLDSRSKGEDSLVFAGLYEIRDGRLVIVDPDDDRLTEFQWTIQNPNTLILADQPEAGKTGADYHGATLTRQVD
jgi:hypothetical protein